MKKIICIMMAMLLVFSSALTINAASIDKEQPETNDIKSMYWQLRRSGSVNTDNISIQLVNKEDGKVIEVEAFALNDRSNQHSKNVYVFAVPADAFNAVPEDNSFKGSGSGSNGDYDNTYSVYGYVESNYLTKTAHGETGYLLTDVAGGWQIVDSSVSIIYKEVNYGCVGITLTDTGHGMYFNQTATRYPTNNTFNYYTNFSKYVINDGNLSLMGINTEATLLHGNSSTWTLTVIKNEF